VNLIEELLKRISSKGDVAVAALGFVIGYLIDSKVALLGLTPGRAGALGSTAAIGLKNGFEAVVDFANRKREVVQSKREASQQAETARRELEAAVDRILELSAELSAKVGKAASDVVTMAARVRMDRELWRDNLLPEQNVWVRIDNFIQVYRAFLDE
jgi:hypothetical protein